ncbi:hypothetical protein M9458_040066, partial [Cirrhinus mrigala]
TNPALSDGNVQEVSVNVEEVMPLPSTSVVQSGAEGSDEPPKDGHVDSTEQVVQSDDVDVVEECAFGSTQTFAL